MNRSKRQLGEMQLKQLFELAPTLLCVLDGSLNLMAINPQWTQTLGWQEVDIIGQSLVSLVHLDDAKQVGLAVENLADAKTAVTFGARFRAANNTFRNLEWSVKSGGDGLIYAVAKDLTDQVQQTQDATYKEKLWQSVLRTAADPIITIKSSGVILVVNPATTELFGYSEEELVGQNVSMLMPQPYQGEHDGYLERYLETGEARIIGTSRDIVALKADGSQFPMTLSISEVKQDGESIFTGIIHDTTEQQEARQKLENLNVSLEGKVNSRTRDLNKLVSELERSNQDLERFAYVASHDLQTPLRNVAQGLELLDAHLQETIGDGFDDEAQDLRQLTLNSVLNMQNLIDGILSYSRVHSDLESEHTHVNTNELVDEVISELGDKLDDIGGAVVREDLPTIVANGTVMRQLFANLLSNSIKYRAPDRDLVVNVSAKDGDDEFVFEVKDNGVGIPDSQRTRIFELFKRNSTAAPGLGIGLALCKRVVESHGGTIEVKSVVGEGSTFTFTIEKWETDS